MRRREMISGAAAMLAAPIAATPKAARAGEHEFNFKQIGWRAFEPGAKEAAKLGRPIFFFAHAEWCFLCKAFGQLFYDEEVVRRMRRFTPVLVDADQDPEINKRYAPTGAYVPRTLFLDSKSVLQPQLHLDYPERIYSVDFLDGPKDLRRLLAMGEAHFYRS